MTRKTDRLVRSFFGLVLFAFSMATGVSHADEVKLYRGAPDPNELADVLFPEEKNKTRNIPMPGGTAEGTPGRPEKPAQPSIAAMLIRFEFDSAGITSESRPALDALGAALQTEQARGKSLLIEGHTDAKGQEQYNLVLSDRRAKAVKEYLVTEHGIEPDRLITLGKGETELLRKDKPHHMDNRRVQFQSVMLR